MSVFKKLNTSDIQNKFESIYNLAKASQIAYWDEKFDTCLCDGTWEQPECYKLLPCLYESSPHGITECKRFYDRFREYHDGERNAVVVMTPHDLADCGSPFFHEKSIIAFKGSSSELDAYVDIDATQTKATAFHGVYIHDGFLTYYKTITKGLWRDLTSASAKVIGDRAHGKSFPDPVLSITGHSLGGAMAMLFCYDFYQRKLANPDFIFEIKECITFAAPRVGDTSFAEDYYAKDNNRTLRIMNYRDFVPNLPPKNISSKAYEHTADVYYLNFFTNQDYLKLLSDGKDEDANTILIEHPYNATVESIVLKHSMHSYRIAIDAICVHHEYDPQTDKSLVYHVPDKNPGYSEAIWDYIVSLVDSSSPTVLKIEYQKVTDNIDSLSAQLLEDMGKAVHELKTKYNIDLLSMVKALLDSRMPK